MLAGLVSLVALATGIAPPAHYRIDLKFTQTVDYTAAGGPMQTIAATISGFVTLQESDTLGGHQAEFRFDSVVVAPGENVPPNLAGNVDAAKGVTYRSMIADGRAVGGFKTTQVEAHANLFQGALDAIFPGFRAAAKTGDRWVDTAMTKDSVPVEKATTTIVSWTAADLSGGVMTLDGVSSGTSKGSQPTPNGQMNIEAKMTGTRHMIGPVGGAATTGAITAKQELSLVLSNLDPFPGNIEQSVMITRLP